MTVMVTGASGHLGGNLVRALLAQGRSVRVLVHHNRQAFAGLDVETVSGDVTDLDSLERAFDGAEVVYHAAGLISLTSREDRLLEAVNVAGVRNVIEACRSRCVRRLVHFSSIHAFEQKPFNIPVDEQRPLVDSQSLEPSYNRSKAAGDRLIRRAVGEGLDAVILYPTGILGPYDFMPSHFGEVMLQLARGSMPALIAAGFDWVDVRDVAEGALLAEARAPSGGRYLLSGHWVSIQGLAETIADYTGVPAPRLVFPLTLAEFGTPFAALFRPSGRRPLYTSVSIRSLKSNHRISHASATQMFGYHSRPFTETVCDTLQWFERMGMLPARRVEGDG